MANTYGRKSKRKYNIFYTVVAALLICLVFLSMVNYFYADAEDEAFEMLHIQTKQIKDDLTLQLQSDRENLITMAHFAAKLYADGESYDRMFASFKPIGLFSNIGILKANNVFVTQKGSVDLNGKISFNEEAAKGAYISGRVPDVTREDKEIIRSAVPIVVDGETVSILYGVIHLDTIGAKYNKMARELDAQLFVYDKETGKFVIDTINQHPGELSQFRDRKFNNGYTYGELAHREKGYSSFRSILRNEDLYIHYSTLTDFNWGIMLAPYESQVFSKTHLVSRHLLISFALMFAIIIVYLLFISQKEREKTRVTAEASAIRKELLEVNQSEENVYEALQHIQAFSNSRSVFFVDTEGEDYHYILPEYTVQLLTGEDRKYLVSELFRYAADFQRSAKVPVSLMRIVPNKHLLKTNADLYHFMKENNLHEVSFAIITDKKNHVSLLGVINPRKGEASRELLVDIAICFSIAIFNKNHLNRTEIAATTDALTGAYNRVSFKKDVLLLDDEKPEDFTCIYIDVNELHIINNKQGHAAGDEMLIYVANTLKEVFFEHMIYRIGGDEFLVFAKNRTLEAIKKNIDIFIEKLKPKNYNVAIGLSHRQQNTNCEEMVREAEVRMYEAKAHYYQNKETFSVSADEDTNYVHTQTGIREIDTMISVLKEHYNGIYRVSLATDEAHRILMPAYLGYNVDEKNFSKLLLKYIVDMVHPDYHRGITSFLNYDAIKRQLSEGKVPRISYRKMNGTSVVLSVYPLNDNSYDVKDTLWVFAKD